MHPTIRTVHVSWLGDLRFEGGAPDGPRSRVDGDNTSAPGPMLTLLLAVATCAGADVVSILKKMQVDLRLCDVEVTGHRAEDHPRRYLRIEYVWRLAGAGLDEAKARRAIDLSLEKYCSVLHSLNPDIPVSYQLHLD